MKIIIDIPQEDYEYIKNSNDFNFNVIKNGIPFPKGHWIYCEETSCFVEHWSCSVCNRDIIENPYFTNFITGEKLNFKWCPYCGAKMKSEE